MGKLMEEEVKVQIYSTYLLKIHQDTKLLFGKFKKESLQAGQLIIKVADKL